MKQVRMRTAGAGPDGPMPMGTIVHCSEEQAAELIAGGYAEAVEESPQAATAVEEDQDAGDEQEDGDWTPDAETATAEPPENAMRPGPRRRTKG